MADRIRFITHHGKQMLLVDLSHCSAAEVEKVYRELPEFVITRPLSSVLILSDFTGASFAGEAMRAMKEPAGFDKLPLPCKPAPGRVHRDCWQFQADSSHRQEPPAIWQSWQRNTVNRL